MSREEILRAVAAYEPRYVTVTGGEPLAQRSCLPLLASLCDAGYEVSLETSGAIDVCEVDPRVIKVMDLKTPSSGEMHRNHLENIQCLNSGDQVKFVIADREDYLWSRQQLEHHALSSHCEILFSPVHGSLAPRELAEWILEDRLPVRFQVQLHKLLWGDVPGH